MGNGIGTALLFLLISSQVFAAVEVDEANCAAQIEAQTEDPLVASLLKLLTKHHSKSEPVARSLVRSWGRRKAYFSQVDSEWFNQIEEAANGRVIEDLWQQLFIADSFESLPVSVRPSKGAKAWEQHAGIYYILDVLTLPSEAVQSWLAEETFHTKPEFDGATPLDPWPIAKRRRRAIETARRQDQNYIMENENGSFTLLTHRPRAGTYFTLTGERRAIEDPPEDLLPRNARYAIIDDDVEPGSLTFVEHKPTAPQIEYLIFDKEGENGRVIGHGTCEDVEQVKLKLTDINLLDEEWFQKGEIRREKSLVHRIALYTLIDRLAVDTLGITNEAELPAARAKVRDELILHLQMNRRNKFMDAVTSYLRTHDPIRFIDYMGPEFLAEGQ